METLVEAINRLRACGYEHDFRAVSGGRLRCGDCRAVLDARHVVVGETVRFEGISNPDDQAILTALTSPCRHRGLFSAAYGPMAEPDDVDVLHALARH